MEYCRHQVATPRQTAIRNLNATGRISQPSRRTRTPGVSPAPNDVLAVRARRELHQNLKSPRNPAAAPPLAEQSFLCSVQLGFLKTTQRLGSRRAPPSRPR
ncbi:hypothetical protein Taro_023282 [Colocasia esculenta]|uniref:Uncharacterized protein n=1 Tax=Colocasia esculenta TaxID=4460 RepID=A0A843V493_COLES|nr:hypothetical protein [Colocasia esculenta]